MERTLPDVLTAFFPFFHFAAPPQTDGTFPYPYSHPRWNQAVRAIVLNQIGFANFWRFFFFPPQYSFRCGDIAGLLSWFPHSPALLYLTTFENGFLHPPPLPFPVDLHSWGDYHFPHQCTCLYQQWVWPQLTIYMAATTPTLWQRLDEDLSVHFHIPSSKYRLPAEGFPVYATLRFRPWNSLPFSEIFFSSTGLFGETFPGSLGLSVLSKHEVRAFFGKNDHVFLTIIRLIPIPMPITLTSPHSFPFRTVETVFVKRGCCFRCGLNK